MVSDKSAIARFEVLTMCIDIRKIAVVVFLLLLSACVVQPQARPGDPRYAPVSAPNAVPPKQVAGSLYQAGYGLALFGDSKAHRVGDVITVVLNERTVSKKSSNVGIKKESDVSFNGGTLLGTNPSFKNLSLDTSIQQNRDFTGEADADQSNSLTGNISVTVANVLPNGNLQVRGEKWMTLNRGDEFIRISGMIRPDDITPNNTVDSTKLANAKISYSGTGELADSARIGWLSRFFNSAVWPF